MGAVMGGAYACDVDLVKLEQLLQRLDLNRLLHFPRTSLRGFMSNTAWDYLTRRRSWRDQELETTASLVEFFDLFTQGKTFEELGTAMAVVAVDIDTGEAVAVGEGSVARAVAAGISIPGIHYPVRIGDRYLVDGGLVNNLPVDVAAKLGADVVIAVEVDAPSRARVTTSLEVLMRAESILLSELTRLRLAMYREQLGDRLLVLTPNVAHVDTLSLSEIEPPVRAGEQEADRRMEEIKALVSG